MTNSKSNVLHTEFVAWLDAIREMTASREESPTTAKDMRAITCWGVGTETLRLWKANTGNAKSRRRWRRRNLPNTQREAAIAQARAVLQRWASEGYARVRR